MRANKFVCFVVNNGNKELIKLRVWSFNAKRSSLSDCNLSVAKQLTRSAKPGSKQESCKDVSWIHNKL